jgi:peptidyl-prolyl cis-trans isomerase A (cyclophilin A)
MQSLEIVVLCYVQFGINGDPAVYAKSRVEIKDDPPKVSNKRGYASFAMSGPDSRTCQIFINFQDNAFLDDQGFSPFAEVVEGTMSTVDSLYGEYGEQPNQGQIKSVGNSYLRANFPKLAFIKKATIVE